MLHKLLSGDTPRSRILAAVLVAILLGLLLAPFLFPGTRSLNVAAKVMVFILLVASYDLLLGYTGIVSFAHTMFFGIGGYGVAIALSRLEVGWSAIALGAGAALAVSLVLSFLIGLFSLRVKAIFFAMITLAVASSRRSGTALPAWERPKARPRPRISHRSMSSISAAVRRRRNSSRSLA